MPILHGSPVSSVKAGDLTACPNRLQQTDELNNHMRRQRAHFCALNSFIISRNVSYTSLSALKRVLTSRR